jgi:hypothetical protein
MDRAEQLKIFARCLGDPTYAIETFLKTFDLTQKGMVPFKLYYKQKEIIRSYEENNRNLVTKPRQAGVSTTTAAYIAVKTAFGDPDNPHKVLILANKQTLAQEFLKKVKDFLDQIPYWVWGLDESTDYLEINSKGHLKLKSNGCEIRALATSKDALRGFTPTFLVMDEAAFIDNGAEVFGAALASLGTGGKIALISCVTDDTFIFTDKGLRQVSDFVNYEKPDNPNEGYYVDSYGILGKDEVRESNIMVNNGLQDTIKITTTNSFLEGTLTHKVWAYRSDSNSYEWTPMGDLKVGDYVNIQYGYEIFGNDDEINHNYKFNNKEKQPNKIYNKIDTNLSYLIGLYLSEGSCYKKYNDNGDLVGVDITITCGDYIGDSIRRAGFNYSCYDGLHYKISSKYLGSLLESLGLDLSLKATEKFIPNKLLSLSKENTSAMIRGFMDGDGYSDSVRGRIGLNISSKKMCLQIRQLLMNYGVLTDYQEGINMGSDLVPVESKYYRISATSLDAFTYYEKIGFDFDRKQSKKISLKEVNINNRYRIIPNGKTIIRDIIDDNGLVRKFRDSELSVNSLRVREKNKSGNLSKNIFSNFIDYITNTLNVDINGYDIDKILMENSKWVPITKIEESKNKTYDFSLPHTEDFWCHSVIYNGILGHQTPNGMDPLYYKTYDKSKTGDNNFNVVEMKWYQDIRYNRGLYWVRGDEKEEEIKCDTLGRTKLRWEYMDNIYETDESTIDNYEVMIKDGWKPLSPWYEEMAADMGDPKKIAQELDVSFIGSGGNVVDDEYVSYHEENFVSDPNFSAEIEKTMWIWKKPEVGHKYVMGVDVSRGDGKDSSTIVILDFENLEQVAEFKHKLPPDMLAEIVYKYGNMYNAYTIVDITGGMGVATVLKLLEMEYKHLHYDDPKSRKLSEKYAKTAYKQGDKVPGFNVGNTRLQMVSELEEHIRENKTIIRSQRMISELKTFVYKNGRPDHMEGYHDDIIMAYAMAIFIVQTSFKKLEQVEKQTKAMLESWVNVSNKETKPMFSDQQHVNPFYTNTPTYNPKQPNNGNNDNGEYNWLFGIK